MLLPDLQRPIRKYEVRRSPEKNDKVGAIGVLQKDLQRRARMYLTLKNKIQTWKSTAADRKIVFRHFDQDYYIEKYPDVKKSGNDPLTHFLNYGWREGRDPSAVFSTSFYLEKYPDVRLSGMNPLVHYIRYGRSEGRIPTSLLEEENHKPIQLPKVGPPKVDTVDPNLRKLRSIIESEFDKEYYYRLDPALREANFDPILHYLMHGWKELRNPSKEFSTAYYLERNWDVREAGLNPFVHYIQHGRREGRQPLPFSQRKERGNFQPLVSVIIPNYNHEKFLPQRIESIINQDYKNIEILILDDASSDGSARVIEDYQKRHPAIVRSIVNRKNSGNVFAQWRLGIENTSGSVFWICESDDFCNEDFLSKSVPQFADPSVMMSFGRIQFADASGNFVAGLDGYRENAEPGIWNSVQVRCARDWFTHGFGVSNLMANVGGCLLRRQNIPSSCWKMAQSYTVLGDWFIYITMAGGGRIAYVPEAVAYFRQHGGNTSVKGFHTPAFFTEQERILKLLRKRWGVPKEVAERFDKRVKETYTYSKAEKHVGRLEKLFSLDRCLQVTRAQHHVLVAFLGFRLGGGELMAIHLANEFLRHGWIVSVLCLHTNDESIDIKNQLDKRIAVYDAQLVKEIGVTRFLKEAGIDIINSHYIGIEYFFFENNKEHVDMPYVVSLHGSYEVSNVRDSALMRFLRNVSHWVYLTDKNLSHLRGIPISRDAITKIGNAMPDDSRPFPQTRKELGIDPADVAFTIVSRGIREKGWEAAIHALKIAEKATKTKLHLLLCGSGDEAERLEKLYSKENNIRFLGYQSHVHGLYRMSDCAVLPTRFPGESFPLSLIQAMQAGTPIIATDIGSIKQMTGRGRRVAGLLVQPAEDDKIFVQNLAAAMVKMADDKFRRRRAADAKALGLNYEMRKQVGSYNVLFNRLIEARSKENS